MVKCGLTHERVVEARGRERVIEVRSIEVRDMGLWNDELKGVDRCGGERKENEGRLHILDVMEKRVAKEGERPARDKFEAGN